MFVATKAEKIKLNLRYWKTFWRSCQTPEQSLKWVDCWMFVKIRTDCTLYQCCHPAHSVGGIYLNQSGKISIDKLNNRADLKRRHSFILLYLVYMADPITFNVSSSKQCSGTLFSSENSLFMQKWKKIKIFWVYIITSASPKLHSVSVCVLSIADKKKRYK